MTCGKENNPKNNHLHLGIIMDGNGRWAKKHSMSRIEGHNQGAKIAKELILPIFQLGVSHLSLFGFSTENWKRNKDEVSALMQLFHQALLEFLQNQEQYQVRFHLIGERNSLPQELLSIAEEVEELTKQYKSMNLYLALNYGGRDDIIHASRQIAKDVSDNLLSVDDINEHTFAQRLYASNAPDPDIILRTGGDFRISNFMLWQAAYSELFFVDTFWPDIDINLIENILQSYSKRERRYGNTS